METKKKMIIELTKEFYFKQGKKKAEWVKNQLIILNKNDVFEMYKRLKNNITTR
jgi:hypothetical protein